jgi:putative ABC transport system permease protein
VTQTLRYTLRKLARAPLFTGITILTLAVGIGANTAIFSVVNGVLLKPLPFDDPDRLVGLWHTAPGLGFDQVNQSPATYFTYREDGRHFEDVGMWDNTQVSVTGLEQPQQLEGMRVTDGTLRLLGVQPAMGRIFTAEDDQPDAPLTTLVSHDYWQTELGGDPSVLGRILTIDGRPHEIIGVMPRKFGFLRYTPDLYLPFQFDRSQVRMGNFSFQGLARLRPDATLAQANADVDRLIPVAVERFPGGLTLGMIQEARMGSLVRPLKEDAVGDVGPVLWILLGTVGMILLIACANVANLFLVRAEGREREVAVRTAMGADRGSIAWQFLSESVVLGLLGGIAGLALAYGGLGVLLGMAPDTLPRLESIRLDPVVLAFTLVISVLAGMLFGLFPVFRYGRSSMVSALKDGGRGNSSSRSRLRARNVLVVSQMALALVLLVGSGLMVRTAQALRDVNPGFTQPDELLTLRLTIPAAEMEDEAQVAATHQEILRRIQEIPGVTSASMSSSITLDGWDSNDAVFFEDFPVPEDQLPPIRRFKFVAPGYFGTMGNRVVAGRDLTWGDIHDRSMVAVITENLAREYWAEPSQAIGRRIREWGEAPYREIVGVVGDVRDDGLTEEPVTTVYWPQVMTDFWGSELSAPRSMGYAIRSPRVGQADFSSAIREAIWSVNSNLPLANVRTGEELLERSMARTSFTLVMLAIAAGVALVLGLVGIYGVISYVVSQRTREIGVRMALGADRDRVSTMVLKQAGALAVAGVGVGLAGAFGLTRLMGSILYGVDPLDPLTFGAVSSMLLTVALVASYLPARRAARVDPVVALRAD